MPRSGKRELFDSHPNETTVKDIFSLLKDKIRCPKETQVVWISPSFPSFGPIMLVYVDKKNYTWIVRNLTHELVKAGTGAAAF